MNKRDQKHQSVRILLSKVFGVIFMLLVSPATSYALASTQFADQNSFEVLESDYSARQHQQETFSLAVKWSQSRVQKVRTRAEVIAEVKRRYSAEVLKIKLDSSRANYRVRVLMPNGKIRNLRVPAKR